MVGLATIYDVADRAGVSIKTVSRVMNAEPNVRAAMRARVQEAATALQYHPDRAARSLAGARSFLIVAFVDASLTLQHWRNERGTDYLARIQLGATLPCRRAGFHLLIELVDNEAATMQHDVQKLLAALKPDGVILTPPSSDDAALLGVLREAGTPYVRLGPERASGGGLRLSLDDHAAARGMTDYLLDLGHRRIGFIEGDRRYGSSSARRAGFLQAMQARGLVTPWMAEGDFTYASGLQAGQALLRRPTRPTAIFASNDDMALGCMAVAAELGLRVPQDLSVAGFDDSTGSRFSLPRLTTLRQPIVEMAALAAERLTGTGLNPGCDEDGGAGLPPFTLMPGLSTAAL